MGLELRTFASPRATELYVSATPDPRGGPDAALDAMMPEVARAVRAHGARPCLARICAPADQIDPCRRAWSAAFGSDPAVPVTWIKTAAGPAVGGIQVYAVRGPQDWKPLRLDNTIAGWTFRLGHHRWAIGGLTAPTPSGAPAVQAADAAPADDGPAQTGACFESAESLLSQAGMNLASVARTWIFMDDILAWYGPFNQVRNRLFQARGMLSKGAQDDGGRVPASTGIGLSPANGARIALEVFAVDGPPDPALGGDPVKRLAAAGKQRSAYEYGSAFARAADALTPAGRTLFVSGTAAIDKRGDTCCLGDAAGQIKMTIDNILAVLREAGYASGQVVQAAAYCNSPEVARLFRANAAGDLAWPWLVAIGDICRSDLLFEVEVTAGAPARS